MISLRYPSYAVRHPNHVCWLNHTMREYYDLWPRFSQRPGPAGRAKEQRAPRADPRAPIATCSRATSAGCSSSRARFSSGWRCGRSCARRCCIRRRRSGRIAVEGWGDYVFMVSRLTPLKRADLLLEALAQPRGAGIRAVDRRRRRGARAPRAHDRDGSGSADRVTFAGRLSDEQLLDHLARCRAVCFPPLDEDYGFVTAEAFASRKAVVTCRDSGGPAELVEDGVSGFVCDADAGSAGARRCAGDGRASSGRAHGNGGTRGCGAADLGRTTVKTLTA